jgi:hypothetical protein
MRGGGKRGKRASINILLYSSLRVFVLGRFAIELNGASPQKMIPQFLISRPICYTMFHE